MGRIEVWKRQLSYGTAVVRYAWKYHRWVFGLLLLSVFSVLVEGLAMGLLYPLSLKASGQEIPQQGLTHEVLKLLNVPSEVNQILIVFCFVFGIRIITLMTSQSLFVLAGKKIQGSMTTKAFFNLIKHVDLHEIEEKSIGTFISLSGDEASRASVLLVSSFQWCSAFVLVLVYYLALFKFSFYLGAGITLFLLLCAAILLQAFRLSLRWGARQQEESRRQNSLILEAVNNLRAVRAYRAEDFMINRYRKELDHYLMTLFKIDFVNVLARTVPALILVLVGAALFAFRSDLVQQQLGFILTVVILMLRFFPAAGQMLNLSLRVMSDSKAGKDITELASEMRSSDGRALDGSIQKIEVKDISFRHANGHQVFKNWSAEFKRTRSYALVGPSGSGKSTLADLLLRLYEPNSGTILVDGKPLKEISRESIREKILLVNQSPALFNDSIEANLTLGFPASNEALLESSRQSHAEDFIATLPDGFASSLRYQGANLSGGQKQRIGLARAFLRQPEILILDESTSALDAKTERSVIENILQRFKSGIVILITHSPDIAALADESIEIKNLNTSGSPIKSSTAE